MSAMFSSGGVFQVDLGLTGATDFVVMHLNLHADVDHRLHHLGAHVLRLIQRRQREVPPS